MQPEIARDTTRRHRMSARLVPESPRPVTPPPEETSAGTTAATSSTTSAAAEKFSTAHLLNQESASALALAWEIHPESGVPIAAELLDSIGHDVRLRTEQHLRLGSPLEIRIFRRDASECYRSTGVPHHCESHGTRHDFGIVLTDPLPNEALLTAHDERRGGLRFRRRTAGRLRSLKDEQNCYGACINYAGNGFGVLSDQPFEIGDPVAFEWFQDNRICRVQGTVRWKVRQDRGFMLGCETTPFAGYRLSGFARDNG